VLHGQTSGNRTSGTAFVVSDDGLLLTAFHVIDGASLIMVKCPGVDPRPAFVEAKAPTVDLAVLRVKWLPPLKDHLSLATGAPAAIGDRVFTIGYPSPNVLGVEPKYTEGTISSTVGPRGDASFYQVSVPVQPGNSGGALLDESGRVLGIIVSSAAPAAFLKDTGTLPQNVNWAVKAVYATPLLPSQQAANNAPKRLNAKDRSAFITHATAASCLVVADQPKGPPQKVVGGVVGGVAGGVAGGVDAPPPPPPPPPPPTVPMRVGGAIHAPRRITNVNPIYPAIAQNARVQGVVIIEATIGTTGEVKDARVLRSIPLLDQAALDAVKQWRYEPTLLNGTAVPIIMTVTVNFALTEDPAKEEQACLAGEIVRILLPGARAHVRIRRRRHAGCRGRRQIRPARL
jgi:TonB family protein